MEVRAVTESQQRSSVPCHRESASMELEFSLSSIFLVSHRIRLCVVVARGLSLAQGFPSTLVLVFITLVLVLDSN